MDSSHLLFITKRLYPFLKHNYDLFIGGVVGFSIFMYICGSNILNPCSGNWMLATGSDTANHYILWLYYKNADWSWPLTLYNTASYPYFNTAMHADIIPLYAIPCKIFRSLLPSNFHYYGIVLMMNFILQGVFGVFLFRQITSNQLIKFVGTLLLTLSPIMVFRMPMHVALSSHWIIILALTTFFAKKHFPNLLQWSIVLVALFIHPYIWIMSLIIISCNQIRECMLNKNQQYQRLFLRMLTGAVICVIGLYLAGFFSVNIDNTAGACTLCNMNLNSFINPTMHQFGQLNKPLPYFNAMQIEGFAYLGTGTIVMALLLIPNIITYISSRSWWFENRVILYMACFFFLFSLGKEITYNDLMLCGFNLPACLAGYHSVFRCCGRMIWPVWYLIVISLFIVVNQIKAKHFQTSLLLLVSIIQIYDLCYGVNGIINYKWHQFYTLKNTKMGLKNTSWLDNLIINKSHAFICFPKEEISDNMKVLIYYFAMRNITVNNFGFARSNPGCACFFSKTMTDLNNNTKANQYIYVDKEFIRTYIK